MNEKPTFTDEKGDKLFGYSQRNLDQLVFWIKATAITSWIILILTFIFLLYLKHYRIIGYALDVIRTSGCA